MRTDQRHTLREGFNATSRPVLDASLPELFEDQVRRTPQAPALAFGGEIFSYAELNRRANHLAHWLIGQGVGPERLVGIALERSAELVVAVLGILKAGAAYLPLDPDYPPGRLAQMLEDAGAAPVLTTAALQDRLPAGAAPFVLLDSDAVRAGVARSPGHDPTDRERTDPLRPGHPAYVIYTSGSTGAPKGVVIEHRSLSAFIDGIASWVTFAPGDRHLAVTTIAFDISVLELFLPLIHGATVVLAAKDDARDPVRLAALIRDSRVDSLQATPSQWHLLIDHDSSCLEDLRILVGGEALPVDLARQLSQMGRYVCNLYGPTEATIWASARALTHLNGSVGTVDLGDPLPNYRIYVLDEALEPVPPGTPGELYIAGSGLARGYSEPPGADRRTLRRRPPRAARRADVPQRRSGAAAGRRRPGFPRPRR